MKQRTIKFRAFDDISKEMHSWYKIKDIPVSAFELDFYSLMQYTGLKDKNGVEIYEGDIIRTEYGVINKISWFRSGWIFNNPITNPDALVRLSDNLGIEGGFEVIGNIYENNHLLFTEETKLR